MYSHPSRPLGFILAVCLPAMVQAGPVFTGLGDLPGGTFYSRALAVSADGRTVVGDSHGEGNFHAFRWTRETGMQPLLDADDGAVSSMGLGISANGTVAAGNAALDRTSVGFRWEASAGTRYLHGGGEVGLTGSEAWAVSDDGQKVVGTCTSGSGTEACSWDRDGNRHLLGDLPDGGLMASARDVSADGSVVVGRGSSTSGQEAFRWTAATGMMGLGDLPGGTHFSEAWGVSADGRVVVGTSASARGNEAFRWTEAGGMQALGYDGLSGNSVAWDVSGDGSIVVGQAVFDGVMAAFIWEETTGMRALQAYLATDHGLDLSGWHLAEAYGISADGQVIVGWGSNPLGGTEAWLVDLGKGVSVRVPEPMSWLLLTLGLVSLRRAARMFRI